LYEKTILHISYHFIAFCFNSKLRQTQVNLFDNLKHIKMKHVSLILSAVVLTAMMVSSCGGGASTEITIGNQVWMTKNLNVSTEGWRNTHSPFDNL